MEMPRPHVVERDHFTLMKNVPPSKGGYNYYTCKHCRRAHNLNPDLDSPVLVLGRAVNYRNHLKTCDAYRATLGSTDVRSDGSDSSTGSTSRRKTRARLVFINGSPRRSTKKRSPKTTKSQRRFTKLQKAAFELLLVEFQAGNFLSDLFVERSCTIALLEFLCPGISAYLPSRRVLGGRIAKAHAQHCREIQTKNLKRAQSTTGGLVNFLSDVWQNISREHLLGCQLLLFGRSLTYALPKAGARHDGVAMAQEMEKIMKQALNEGWCIGAVVTDNAGQCGRARRILALRWPNVTFLFCFAHCINNIVKAVLKSSFSDVAKQATAAVKAINASSSKWLVHARALMKECYGKSLALFTLCETRWNSMQGCFASLLRVRTSLVMLAGRYQGRADFPNALKVFSDNKFWADLSSVEHAIAPLSEASYQLQRDENTLADVVVSFRDIFGGFGHLSVNCRSELKKCVEVRWGQCEQPLFMLTLLLNPATADLSRTLIEEVDERKRVAAVDERLIDEVLDEDKKRRKLQEIEASKDAAKIACSTQLAKFAVYYYRRLIGANFDCIRNDLIGWIEGRLTLTHPREFRFHKVEFWKHVKKENPTSLLPDLAIRLFSIADNTATTERLFSELGMIHTPHRNRMTLMKAQNTQCIRQCIRESAQNSTENARTVLRIIAPAERQLIDTITEMAGSHAVAEGSPATPFSGVTGDLNPRTPVVQTPSQLPTRRSPRYTTPMSQQSSRQNTPAAPVIPPNVVQTIDEDDVDDIGDGGDAKETFPHWVEYLDGVFDDDEIGSAFAASEDNSYLNWELEEIPAAIDTVFPDTDNGSFPQENKIVGIRALKASLSALYASNSSR